MCFEEFVAYTCGHRSLSVLRPCPLTTASHTFPTCSRRGDKPFLANEMCAPCQKIIHSRATQIEETEHRFMHERGACGCAVVFPYLIRPRVISRVSGNEEGDVRQLNDAAPGEQDAAAENKVADHLEIKELEPSSGDSSVKNEQLPPLLEQTTDAEGNAVVSVRLPSLFAAEWVEDHRLRHEAGMCQCRMDFRTYQEAKKEKEDKEAIDSAETHDGVEYRRPCFQSDPSYRAASESPHGRARGDNAEDSDDEDSNNGKSRRIARSADGRLQSSRLSAHPEILPPESEGAASIDSLAAQASEADTIANGEQAGTKADGLTFPGIKVAGSPSDIVADMKIVRFAGAIFTKVPDYLPLTGPFLAQSALRPLPVDGILVAPKDTGLDSDEVQKDADNQGNKESSTEKTCDTTKDEPTTSSPVQPQGSPPWPRPPVFGWDGSVPIAGLPLGAGPEGILHTAPWDSVPKCWKDRQGPANDDEESNKKSGQGDDDKNSKKMDNKEDD